MRNILISAAVAATLLAVPAVVKAGDTVNGAVGGAVTGAVVGGPVGAAVGGVVGGTVGAASDEQHRRDEDRRGAVDDDAARVDTKTCVTHSDGSRDCRESTR